MKLPIEKAVKLIKTALEKESEEHYYRWWLVRYPLYTEKNYESFEDFYDKIRPKRIEMDGRSEDEIMSEIMEVEKKFRKEEDNGII